MKSITHHTRVFRTNAVVGIDTQSEIVIAPNADGICISQQPTRFLNPLSHLEHVADNHNLLDAAPAELVECRSQMFDVFMDVRDQAELHLLECPPTQCLPRAFNV